MSPAVNASCFSTNDGSLTVAPAGGNGSYTYLWSNGATGAQNTGLGAGNYNVTVSDTEGCTATAAGTIASPPQLLTGAVATPQSANGTTDGTASANPSGGTPAYTFLWSNGETTADIQNLSPGSYTVTVTDGNNCTAVKTVTVNQYDCTIQSDVNVQNISCFGAGNGQATLNITGGTSPFSILWSTGDTSLSLNNLSVGQYAVSITDAANCPEQLSFTIEEPDTLVANVSTTATSGPNTSNGSATANPIGDSGV
ncbi:MAG: SprB repeat-containing protein [Lewinellaceae bacterium]|nr:SprB repeat-containing protein [Lewinellaceae bacterium]